MRMTRCRKGWRSWGSPEKVLIIAPQLVEENSTRLVDGMQCPRTCGGFAHLFSNLPRVCPPPGRCLCLFFY